MLLGCAAFGRIDDLDPLLLVLSEVALKLVQVRCHLQIGVHRPAVDVVRLGQMQAVSHDPLPFHHLDRVERIQFGCPNFMDRGPRRVVKTVAEPQVLTDQRDRIAPQIARDVHRQVRNRRAGRDRSHRSFQITQQHVQEISPAAPQRAGICVENHRVALWFSDQRHVAHRLRIKPVIEPA